MKALFDVPAPAKLNLFLHITGRRSDGYHLLQSVFMLIDWCDTLHFEFRADGKITREDLTTELPLEDLIVRAAQALKASSACPSGVHIGIEKRIPAQAGMGGGSSDAASTLLALNKLWGLNYTCKQLSQIGLKLGADVPFFLSGHNAWVEGIGEKITPVEIPVSQFLVVKPAAGLETRQIFSDPLLKRDTGTAIISSFAANVFAYGRNDLQSVAERLCPSVTQAIDWLALQGMSPRMTGSGSSVFAHMLNKIDLLNAPSGFLIKACNSLAVHPLAGWTSSENLSVGSFNCQPV